jgi:hypothetical protein
MLFAANGVQLASAAYVWFVLTTISVSDYVASNGKVTEMNNQFKNILKEAVVA